MSRIVNENRGEFFSSLCHKLEELSSLRVLRNVDVLTEASLDNDIDILVEPKVFKEFSEFLKSWGFTSYNDSYFLNIFLYGTSPHTHFVV